MIRVSVAGTNRNRQSNKNGVKYPDVDDPRFKDEMIFPILYPGFTMSPGQKVFTIGSCFARNIERELKGYVVPTLSYRAPEGDPLAPRVNTVFNEYNPGTIARRIEAATGRGSGGDLGIIAEGDGHSDFFITGSTPCDIGLVRKRRSLMDKIYEDLPTSDVLVVTLGMTEAWFDRETGTYLNRAPGGECFRDPEGKGARFEFHVLGVRETIELLSPAFERAFSAGLKRIILTVSPVPLQRSFSNHDAVVANSQSKATLRCAAGVLTSDFDRVDYFPSYEMVSLFAGNPYIDDNVHVKPEIVARVTRYMRDVYEKKAG